MTPFEELLRIANEAGVAPALDYLEQNVRREKNYPSLFEVLKMRVRHRLGLPLLYSEKPDELSDEQQRQLEDGLIAACREVGTLLMREGQVQQGWVYLQPVGDRDLNQKLLESISPTEENIDGLIDVAVTQGAAPALGFRWLLQHYGTCNGITSFETQSAGFNRETQREMAVVLLEHLYAELLDNIRYALRPAEGETPTSADAQPVLDTDTLATVMQKFPHLTEHGAHHIDTTHLASLMRIARLVEQPEHLQKAYQLAQYGSRLAEDYHYAGHPPFEDTYVGHRLYFGALTGDEDVERALTHFYGKVETVDQDQFGPIAIETTVELLYRLGRNDEALDLTIDRLLGKHRAMGIAPDPMTIANTEALRDRLIKFYRQQNDLVSFAAGLLGGR